LIEHRICYFDESRDVGSIDIVYEVAFFAVFNALAMNRLHYSVEFFINYTETLGGGDDGFRGDWVKISGLDDW